MMIDTPETQVIEEMETPVELSMDEVEDARYSYDLPQNDTAKSSISGEQSVIENNSEGSDRASEEESESELPGDPRDPHQTQPPTSEQF